VPAPPRPPRLGIKETTYIVERATRKIVAKEATPEDALNTLGTLP
jgi:hypothetical protein